MTYQPELNGAGPRGKRSWGDRLRLGLPKGTAPEGPGPGGGGGYLLHEYRGRYGSVSGGSALSKSMKYAETWLYGTVSARPAPTRASAFGLHRQDPPPPILAVVMCSCPEFLAGTTRSKKTSSTCKKCGGTRRPMPTTVGTVRGYGTVSQPARVRPSLMDMAGHPVLGQAPDPYDLMRRSRMAVDGGGHKPKSRAKSSSPPRRRRTTSPAPPHKPATRLESRDVGEWATAEDEVNGFAEKRKSILECEVNPYDLISKYLKNGSSIRVGDRTRNLCSDGGESSDNLSDNALEDLPARERPEMTTFGKGPQHNKNVPQLPPAKKSLFLKEDLTKLGSKLSNLKQNISLDSKKAIPRKTESTFKLVSSLNDSPQKPSNEPNKVGAGVTISGQRIRIFNGTHSGAPASGDAEYVSDDALDEHMDQFEPKDPFCSTETDTSGPSEEELAPTAAGSSSPLIPRVSSPKRPPRKSKQQPQEAPEASHRTSPPNLQLRRQRSQSLVSPMPEVSTTIKSILKKSQADLLSPDCTTTARNSPSPLSSAEGSISSATSQFYLPTFKEFKEQQKKKKQVQFREVPSDSTSPGTADPSLTEVVAEPADLDAPDTASFVIQDKEEMVSDADVTRSATARSLPAGIQAIIARPAVESTDEEEASSEQATLQEGPSERLRAPTPPAQPLRRSLSERLSSASAPPRRTAKDGSSRGGGRGQLGQLGRAAQGDMFNDTMRLRMRGARPSSRHVFSDDSSGAEDNLPRRMLSPPRPREPPPPPPLPPQLPPRHVPGSAEHLRRHAEIPSTDESQDDEALTLPPLGERPAPIGRTHSNAQAYEELVRGQGGKVSLRPPQQVHRLQVKGEPDGKDTLPSLDIDALAQRTTSIFIECGGKSPDVLPVRPESPMDNKQVGNKVTISVGGSLEGDIDYQELPFGPAATSTPTNAPRPVVIPVAHQNHCSRVEIGDQSDEKRTSTKMTVRIGPNSTNNPEPETSNANIITMKPSQPTETINLLIQESVDPVDAVRRNLVPHVCGGEDVVRELPDLLRAKDSCCTRFDEGSEDDRKVSSPEPILLPPPGKSKTGADIMREVLSLGEEVCRQQKETGRSKFYVWVDSTASELDTHDDEVTVLVTKDFDMSEVNHYEMIRDPIYEEIHENDADDVPPPLPLSPPPDMDKMTCCRSIFEGASKDDILSYLVDAKERGIVPEEMYFGGSSTGDDSEDSQLQHSRQTSLDLTELSSRVSQLSNTSDSSEDSVNLLISNAVDALEDSKARRAAADIERNDSGVGSETSRTSRARWQQLPADQRDQRHGCEDCEMPVETQVTDSGVMFAPLVCRKCSKRRLERREIIQEIVETEEKFAGDLRILLDEFYRPMLVAGLLARDQLSAIFLNAEELLAHAAALAERLRDSLEMAVEQGDDDLLSVDIGRLFLAATPMLRAFEHYCTRQAAASLLLASLEKEKELLRIFLRVSQMENAVLRRMNLNSFLMVPVQRVTKYPLLLARLYKVTPSSHPAKELLLQAQHHIELHLEHMNSVAKDISSTKLWRRITIINGRRAGPEADMVNIKLRKMAVEVLEWTQDVSFPMEGRLLFAQPADSSWRRGRAVKMSPVNALLVTQGHPASDAPMDAPLHFPAHSAVRAATLLLLKEKCGRYSLLRDPLFLDKCMVCCEVEWDDYFEVQELSTKDSFIFKAEDAERTRAWYRQLQLHAQGLGSWRRRRNALANIMINGMQLRS